jgi:NOL1/NOP2/fmu family ribosome biogenesis protein
MRSFLQLPVKSSGLLQEWINPAHSGSFLVKDDQQYFFPSSQLMVLYFLDKNLNILQAGTPVATGSLPRFNPHPALAMSVIYNPEAFPEIDVGLQDALRYMKREILHFPEENPGWIKVSYKGVGLGWIKNLGTRTNNYFPRERRIRMEFDKVPTLWHETEGQNEGRG